MTASAEHPDLAPASRRFLSSFDATMLVMGGIVGVGIFFQPATVAALVREPWAFLLTWGVGGLLALCGAFTFAEWGATLPRAGGWFVYLREAYGRAVAFLFAWIVLFVVSTGALAVMASFCAAMLASLFPALGPQGSTARAVAAGALIAGVTGLALAGLKVGALFQNGCMIVKLLAIAALTIAGLVIAAPADAAAMASAAPPAPPLPEGLLRAMLPVLFTFGGWQMLGYTASEVREPARTLPRAILLGVTGTIVVYLMVNVAFLRVLGTEGLAAEGPGRFAAAVARRSFGASGEQVLSAAMAVSALGVTVVTVVATPWVHVAMARAGLFFAPFARLHPRTGAPALGLYLQAAIALGYLALGHVLSARLEVDVIEYLTGSVVFAEWIFHALVAWGLLRLRRRRPDLARPFRAPTVFPLAYAALAVVVVAGNLTQGDPWQVGTGLVVLGLGLVAYLARRQA